MCSSRCSCARPWGWTATCRNWPGAEPRAFAGPPEGKIRAGGPATKPRVVLASDSHYHPWQFLIRTRGIAMRVRNALFATLALGVGFGQAQDRKSTRLTPVT